MMSYKRKEVIGDCTLYLGDCLEVMPTLGKVDSVVTDPPYGISAYSTGSMGAGVLAKQSQFKKTTWDAKPIDKVCIKLMQNISNKQIIWGGNYFELPPSQCWLVWDKENGSNNFADCELAWTNLSKSVRLIKWKWQGMLQKNMGHKKENRVHPTQKPLGVMEWCIEKVEGEILDPFMGSGTTLVACAKMGRKGIGIELDEDYFNIACKRVEEAYKQPDMFVEQPKAISKQEDLLT